MKKAFNKENRTLTISLIILLTLTTTIYILSALGYLVNTEMPLYQTIIGTAQVITSYAFFYELGKHNKNEKDCKNRTLE